MRAVLVAAALICVAHVAALTDPTTAGQYTFVSCWQDIPGTRTLNGQFTSADLGGDNNQTVENCAAACTARGYSIMGLEYYYQVHTAIASPSLFWLTGNASAGVTMLSGMPTVPPLLFRIVAPDATAILPKLAAARIVSVCTPLVAVVMQPFKASTWRRQELRPHEQRLQRRQRRQLLIMQERP